MNRLSRLSLPILALAATISSPAAGQVAPVALYDGPAPGSESWTQERAEVHEVGLEAAGHAFASIQRLCRVRSSACGGGKANSKNHDDEIACGACRYATLSRLYH